MNFYFIGIATKQSSMVRIMPLWAKALTVDLNLICVDLPAQAKAEQYRDVISQIKNDSNAIGSVVTSHKLQIYEHNMDRFDEIDMSTNLTKEVGTIVKRKNRLIGMAAPDCLSMSISLKNMLGDNYWQKNKSKLLCFGAGGAARAIILSLLFDFEVDDFLNRKQKDKPNEVLLIDNNQNQLDSMEKFLEPFSDHIEVKYIFHSRDRDNDQLMTDLSSGSLVVNATGMGKDQPGSPLSNEVCFPKKSIVWDLNYRGERLFLEQARSHSVERELFIYDGWMSFLYGWIESIQLALEKTFSKDQIEQLKVLAETTRAN